MPAQLCTQAASVKRLETRTLVVLSLLTSLSVSLCRSLLLPRLLRSLAYCIRLVAQSAHLFIVCCSYDLRFSCCSPSLFFSSSSSFFSAADYRWQHGSRRRAQLRHLLEFHSTWLESVSLGLSSRSRSRRRSRRLLCCPCARLCDGVRAPFAILIHLFCFSCEPRIANEQNV